MSLVIEETFLLHCSGLNESVINVDKIQDYLSLDITSLM